jgi:hypothetical protein
MNLDQAVSAHQQWKMRLKMYVGGSRQEKLDPAMVWKDDQCDLGKWILGVGSAKHGSRPEFRGLKEWHEYFHRCAAEVVRKVQVGDAAGAKKLLDSEFYKYSSEVVMGITRLRNVIGE